MWCKYHAAVCSCQGSAQENGMHRVPWDIPHTVAMMCEAIENTHKKRRVDLLWYIPVFMIPLTSLIEIHERKADVEFQETSCHNPIHSRIIKSTPSYSSCVFNTLTRELRVETNKNLLDQRGLVVLDKKTFLALSLTLTI